MAKSKRVSDYFLKSKPIIKKAESLGWVQCKKMLSLVKCGRCHKCSTIRFKRNITVDRKPTKKATRYVQYVEKCIACGNLTPIRLWDNRIEKFVSGEKYTQ